MIVGNALYHGAVTSILGRRLEKGESVLQAAFPPEVLKEWQGYYNSTLRGEQFSVEVADRFVQPPHMVEYHLSPLRAENGTITGVTVYGRDVTEQRHSDAVAHERKEKLDKLLDLLPVGVSVLDGNRNIVFSRSRPGRNFGLDRGRGGRQILCSAPISGGGRPAHAPAGFASAQAMATGRPALAVETGIAKEDGEVIWTSVSAVPVDFPDWRVIITTVDITELKRTQQELVELNRTLEARVVERTAEIQDLYDRAPAGYHSLDSEGRIIRINQTELDWLGYTREEVLGRPVADFFTPASRAAFQVEYAGFLARTGCATRNVS